MEAVCNNDRTVFENERNNNNNYKSLIGLSISCNESKILSCIFSSYITKLEKFVEPEIFSKAISKDCKEIFKVFFLTMPIQVLLFYCKT